VEEAQRATAGRDQSSATHGKPGPRRGRVRGARRTLARASDNEAKRGSATPSRHEPIAEFDLGSPVVTRAHPPRLDCRGPGASPAPAAAARERSDNGRRGAGDLKPVPLQRLICRDPLGRCPQADGCATRTCNAPPRTIVKRGRRGSDDLVCSVRQRICFCFGWRAQEARERAVHDDGGSSHRGSWEMPPRQGRPRLARGRPGRHRDCVPPGRVSSCRLARSPGWCRVRRR
jgi:hypothetical protein